MRASTSHAAARPRLRLFGAPHIDYGGEEAALPNERRAQLVVWLALKRAWLGRAELAALLWPELDRKLAFTNLRKALHRLQATPWGSGLETQGQALRFVATTDVAEFEAALADGRAGDAMALRTGELLAGFDDDANEAWTGWLRYERDRLRAAWRGAALAQLAGEMDAAAAVELAARLLAADALDEAALVAHMHWLARSGQVAQARQAFGAFAERLQQELGLAPSAELKSQLETLGLGHAAGSGRAPAPPAAADDGFIGRQAELRQIAEMLARPDCAMLSLIGPGGVGKTRLARRAMHELVPRFADGAVFVPLEDVTSAAEIGPRLAREFGLALAGKAAPLAQVMLALKEREALLVLDNFEHLAADAAWLGELVRSAPRLKIIVTSRVRPAAQAAWSLPIEGLPCPEAEDEDQLESFDAARLFIKAAQRVEPALLPATEAAAIADICRHLGGLPLALELAASWTRVLSCAAIARELREGTELLRSTDPARPARQASIEAVFEQSWHHLVPAERSALARLAVFRGGFSAAAAREVAGASLPVLGALADKSLLRKEGARCHLHPLVQQFAAERLHAGGERAAAEQAHAEYFQRLIDQLRGALPQGQREALRLIDAEFDNCRAAWRRAVALGRHRALAAYAPALRDYCDHKGRYADGLALLNEALAAAPDSADALYEALLGSAAAHMLYRLDRYGEAEAGAARALATLRRGAGSSAERETRLQCLKTLGVCALMQGRHDEARRPLQKVLEMAQADGDMRNEAGMLDNLSLIEKAAGRFDEARRMTMQSLLQYRRLDHAAGVALCLNNLGSLAMALHEPEAAAVHFQEGLQICDHHGLHGTRSLLLANLAELALARGRFDEAEASARRALEATRQLGNRGVEAWLLQVLATVALKRGQLAEARVSLGVALDAASQVKHLGLTLEGVIIFAEVLHAMGAQQAARRALQVAIEQTSVPATIRARASERLQAWSANSSALPPWNAPPLEELVQRIVLETSLEYAPLIEVLKR